MHGNVKQEARLTIESFPYAYDGGAAKTVSNARYFEFKLAGCSSCLGYILPHIAERFPLTSDWDRNSTTQTLTFKPSNVPSDPEQAAQYRTKILAKYLQETREARVFQVLDGWRDELYPVFGPDRQLLFSMERSASPLFGIVTYGVHMTAYIESDQGIKVWVPRRAPTKQTYPGMMDNTVAGGLTTGEKPFECLVRESMEEASLPCEVVQHARACGTMTYFHLRDGRAGGEIGLCQPECQYVYDLVLPDDVIPKPGDDEAVDFRLFSLDEVKAALAAGQFKPNCAMLLVEFFVRHGILTPENEPDYLEIVSRVHRRLQFPLP